MGKLYDTVRSINTLINKYSSKAQLLRPPIGKYGHIATNLLYILSNQNNQHSESLTSEIIKNLEEISGVVGVDVVDNFINIWIDYNNLFYELEQTDDNTSINVEYCSPNPTGDMHLGHLRVAIFGSVLCNLLSSCGYNVTSELYVNDIGKQIDQLLESIEEVKQGKQPKYYNNDRIKELAQSTDPVKEQVEYMLNQLKVLKINFTEIQWESRQKEHLQYVIDILTNNKVIFRGQIPDQKTPGEVVAYKDPDNNYHVLQRSDNTPTYFAMDLAYAYGKKKRGYQQQICITGEDHKGHTIRMCSALRYLDIDYIPLSYGLIMIEKDGNIQPMSKRNNTLITLQEFVNTTPLNNILTVLLSIKLCKTMVYNNSWVSQDLNIIDQLDYYTHKIQEMIKTLDINIKVITLHQSVALNQLISFVSLWSYTTHNATKQKDPHIYFDNLVKLVQSLNAFFDQHSVTEIQQCCSKQFLANILTILKEAQKILLKSE